MRRVIAHALVALLLPLLASCASSAAPASANGVPGGASAGPAARAPAGAAATVALTRVGEAVQITENAESTWECEYITEIPLRSQRVSDTDALLWLRNEAGRSGANLVLLVMETTTTIERAEGYLCAD